MSAGLRAGAGLVVAAMAVSSPSSLAVAAEPSAIPPLSAEIPSDIDVRLRDSIEAAGAPNWRIQVHRLFEQHLGDDGCLSCPVDAAQLPSAARVHSGPWAGRSRSSRLMATADLIGAGRSIDIGAIGGPRDGTLLGSGCRQIHGPAHRLGQCADPAQPERNRTPQRSRRGEPGILEAVWDRTATWSTQSSSTRTVRLHRWQQLYDIEGQVEFFRRQSKLDFPGAGSARIGRRHRTEARRDYGSERTISAATSRCLLCVPVGRSALAAIANVGFHIAQKTELAAMDLVGVRACRQRRGRL